jgi:hypothetical protein
MRLSDRSSGAPYKSASGYGSPYGDYLELEVDSQGRNHIVWGAGPSWSGYGGGIWYTRGIQAAGSSKLIGTSCKHSKYPASAFGPRIAGAIPYIGDPFALTVTKLPPASTNFSAIGLLGLTQYTTPIDLSITGLFLPKCFLHVNFFLEGPLARDPSSTSNANWAFVIPCDQGLVGRKFYAQAAVVDLANPRSWMLTNAYEGKIGSR